jgi:very-short-patch-repair endonuclease
MVGMDHTELLELAGRQHGYVRREDVRAAGVTRKLERAWVARGEWLRDGPRLLRRRGAPVSKASKLMAAVLDAGPGGFISHGTAAAWWGLPGFDLAHPHVTRARGITGTEPTIDCHLHEVVDLTPRQVTVLDGIPIVRPERLAFELFGSAHPLRAGRATETAWSKGLVSGPSLRAVFDELAGRGRSGTVAMREFLECHHDLWVPPASNLEARFAELVQGHGLGPYRRQVDLGDDHWVGRVDFLHQRFPLVVEVQSERFHTALLDRAHDRRRLDALAAGGFTVVEVWDREVWHDTSALVHRIREVERPFRSAEARRLAS